MNPSLSNNCHQQDTDLLKEILKEVKALKKQNKELGDKIKRIEQDVDLIRHEQKRQGVRLAEFLLKCAEEIGCVDTPLVSTNSMTINTMRLEDGK